MLCSCRTYSLRCVPVLFVLAVCLSFGASSSPSGKKKFLILAEYDPAAATNHIIHLVRIPLTDGIPGPREKIMDVVTQQAGDKSPRIRFDLGRNQIYQNRFVITAYGQVVDLTTKKVLVDTHDNFVKASGDSIVFFTDDIFRGKFYSILKLTTGVYAQVADVKYNPKFGQDVEPDCSSRNFKIWFFPPSKPKIEVVKDAGYGEDVSLIPNGKPSLPMHWLDQSNFIFPYYNASHDAVTIFKVNYVTHEQKKIGTIDQLPENRKYSSFFTDPEGNLIYSCARGYFRIDIAKSVVVELTTFHLGSGFEIALDETPGKGNEIKRNGQSIGHYFCTPESAVAAEGVIAFPYEIVMEKEHYLQGAAYWANEPGKWKTTGDSDLSAVVGWIIE